MRPAYSSGASQPAVSVTSGSRRLAPPQSPSRTSPHTLSAPTGGLHGLAALGRSMASGGAVDRADTRDKKPFAPDGPSIALGAIDADQLADLLRREAERCGIDLAGLEP
jgi:hypothetical protein